MCDDVLERFTRQYIQAQHAPEVTFAWQGGEPTLMGLDFFRRAIALQEKYRRPEMRVRNTLQTNATTLNDEWCEFLRTHDFLVGISLDGPRKLHDAYRVDKGGAPTFDRVMQGIGLLRKHGVQFNILAAVHAANEKHPLQVYRFLRDDVHAPFLQFIPIVERNNETGFQEGEKVAPRSVDGKEYGRFLIAIFDEPVRRDVGRIFVQVFDVALCVWSGQPAPLCVFGETCGSALTMEHNGDLFSCDHFVEPRHKLGSFSEIPLTAMVGSEQQYKFGLSKRDTLPHC